MTITEYHDSKLHHMGYGLSGATGALCPDGVRRNAYPALHLAWVTADTFFSVPMFVYAKGKRVYGSVSVDSVSVETITGYSTATDDDPATVVFQPYRYRKNWHLVSPPEGE